jgi:serine phosphatase RsbU (regulator of sigma subunit)
MGIPGPSTLRIGFPGTGRAPVSFEPRSIDAPVVLGRPSKAGPVVPDVELVDEAVSRRHAECMFDGSRWHVRSLGKGGTALDGRLVPENAWVPLGAVSMLAIGPFRMRLTVGSVLAGSTIAETVTFSDAEGGARPEAVSRTRLESAEVRLSALLAAARRIGASDDELPLCQAVVDVLVETRDFDRAFVMRAGAEGDPAGWMPVASAAASEHARALPVSRTLLGEARATGGMVRLDHSMARLHGAASLVASGATAAICAPIPSTTPARLFLYADTRSGGALGDAAVPFADMVAQLAGLTLSAAERRALQGEMVQARKIQERLLPDAEGECGCVRWSLYSRPAAHAPGVEARPSGDFFTVIEAGDGRVAAFIGDVAGKGAGAAIVMASSVAHLDGAVRRGMPIEEALAGVSEFFVRRPNLDFSVSTGGFSTAIAVEIRPDGACRGVDAAHCYAAVVRADGHASRLEFPNRTTMIGYAAGIELVADEFRLAPGDRLVLFSDGVVDQQDRSGRRFCEAFESDPEPVLAALRGSSSASDDVQRLVAALERFAQGVPWSDDVTVASIALATLPA